MIFYTFQSAKQLQARKR